MALPIHNEFKYQKSSISSNIIYRSVGYMFWWLGGAVILAFHKFVRS